jgi:hypothetical protein
MEIWSDSQAGDERHYLDRQNSRSMLVKISIGAMTLTLALLSSGGLPATALYSFAFSPGGGGAFNIRQPIGTGFFSGLTFARVDGSSHGIESCKRHLGGSS